MAISPIPSLRTGRRLLFAFPAIFFIQPQFFKIALQAQPVVAADGAAARGAAPLFFLLGEKIFQAVGTDGVEVGDHAHVIFFAVAFVERLQPRAGEVTALETKSYEPFADLVTAVPHKSAVFAARDTPGAIFSGETPAVDVMLHRQVTGAQRTVHPAGRDEFFFHHRSPFLQGSEVYHTKTIAREVTGVIVWNGLLRSCDLRKCSQQRRRRRYHLH